MILFGLPQAASDDPFRAAQCARGLCVSTQRWLASLPPAVRSRLGFKVGAHFGTIVASRLGGGSYHHITATGDTVNVASRLMEVAAGHEVELALSDELFRAVGRDRSLFEAGVLTGPVETRLRGRSGSLDVWFWRSRSEKFVNRRRRVFCDGRLQLITRSGPVSCLAATRFRPSRPAACCALIQRG